MAVKPWNPLGSGGEAVRGSGTANNLTKWVTANQIGNAAATESGGVISFNSFPLAPTADPTTDYQLSTKKYVDDQLAGVSADRLTSTNFTWILSDDAIDGTLTFNGGILNFAGATSYGFDTRVGIGIAADSNHALNVYTQGNAFGLNIVGPASDKNLRIFYDDSIGNDQMTISAGDDVTLLRIQGQKVGSTQLTFDEDAGTVGVTSGQFVAQTANFGNLVEFQGQVQCNDIVEVIEPTDDNHAASRQYVDDAIINQMLLMGA